jgi:Mn2+/Fe2+ NRAMP family transporter
MTLERSKPKNAFRRVERWVVGLVMGVIAFVLERVVLRSIKKTGSAAKADPTPIQSTGSDISA